MEDNKQLKQEIKLLKKQLKDMQSAITKNCIVCCVNDKESITNCKTDCPLNKYRPFQK